MKNVDRIACNNNAWFVMNFSIQWKTPDGNWHTSEWNSGNYKKGDVKVSPSLSAVVGVPDDAVEVRPYVKAILGKSESGQALSPASDGQMVAYDVSGTTLNFSVELTDLKWQNWSANLVHNINPQGDSAYFVPVTKADLQALVRAASAAGAKLRVSGQRHSQPPVVIADNRTANTAPNTWLVDMSCYHDLGDDQSKRIVAGPGPNQVTVNSGVREDEVESFLTANNLTLNTVTAGGFFSVGGMTAIDVHGATVKAPIFAETASAYTLMDGSGNTTTIDTSTPAVDGWSPIQFARVSLGALGLVTSITIDVLPRPWATTLQAGKEHFSLSNEAEFVAKYKDLLTTHDRIESFLNPYNNNYLALIWDLIDDPATKTPNLITNVPTACSYTLQEEYGAPGEGALEPLAQAAAQAAQAGKVGRIGAQTLVDTAMSAIESMFEEAKKHYADMWLTKAARTIFMSYFVELPNIDDEGLGKAWKCLDSVITRLAASQDFLLAGPFEFRFVKGGDTALASTYTTNENATFINLDLIAFVPEEQASDYPAPLLQFFADIERDWVALGGMPHNGKMWGFHDPADPTGHTAPFNPAFIEMIVQKRKARTEAFDKYRQSRDPSGMFTNDYVATLLKT